MGVVDKFKEFVAPIDDEGDDILEVEEEVEETPRSRLVSFVASSRENSSTAAMAAASSIGMDVFPHS